MPPPDSHSVLVRCLERSFDPDAFTTWASTLSNNPFADGFRAIWEVNERSDVLRTEGFESVSQWLSKVVEWKQAMGDPLRNTQSTGTSRMMLQLWQLFEEELGTRLIRARAVTSGIPERGGVLAFVAGVKVCLVIEYQVVGKTAVLRSVDVIEHPRSVFDFLDSLADAEPHTQNKLKSILSTGHKLVFHRGVLVHVDKRDEDQVSGPFIDTVWMSELLARRIYDIPTPSTPAGNASPSGPTAVLEIGTGSGLLIAGAARYMIGRRHGTSGLRIVGIDAEMQAVGCTYKNLRINEPGVEGVASECVALIKALFVPEQLNERFDLVVCNPPYIPDVESATADGVMDQSRRKGVIGLNLARSVVQNLPLLLKPGGSALIMTSSVSGNEIRSAIPGELTVEQPFGDAGIEVRFDVEDVVADTNRLRGLVGWERRGTGIYHQLHPLWITLPHGARND